MDGQWASVRTTAFAVQIELPAADTEVVPGVAWGRVEAFPTPAYWAYQVMARRIEHRQITYRLGETLREEVGACVLGGHGIPAQVGLAAFRHLKAHGIFRGTAPNEADIRSVLEQPLDVAGRSVRYRFVRQKARYLACALQGLDDDPMAHLTGRALRDALLQYPGIGLKTASWITRNWLSSDEVAILDIHVLRAGILGRFFDATLTVERHYRELEDQFLRFSEGLGVRASELDAVIWLEMMSAPRSVASALDHFPASPLKTKHAFSARNAHREGADAHQLPLLS